MSPRSIPVAEVLVIAGAAAAWTLGAHLGVRIALPDASGAGGEFLRSFINARLPFARVHEAVGFFVLLSFASAVVRKIAGTSERAEWASVMLLPALLLPAAFILDSRTWAVFLSLIAVLQAAECYCAFHPLSFGREGIFGRSDFVGYVNVAVALAFILGSPWLASPRDPWLAAVVYAFSIARAIALAPRFRLALSMEVYALIASALGAGIWVFTASDIREMQKTLPLIFVFSMTLAHASVLLRHPGGGWRMRLAAVAPFVVGVLALNLVLGPPEETNKGEFWARYIRKAQLGGRDSRLSGRVVPPGIFPGLPLGWWVETDFFSLGRPKREKAPGAYRIIVQGSSSTEAGSMSKDKYIWTTAMEDALNAAGLPYRVEVINAGIGGATTFGLLLNLKEALLDYKPDMLVLYVADSDSTYFHTFYTDRELYALASAGAFDGLGSLDGNSAGPANTTPAHLIDGWRRAWRPADLRTLPSRLMERMAPPPASRIAQSGNPQPSRPAVPPEHFQENLSEYADIAEQHRFALVFIGEASRIDLGLYKTIMTHVAAERGLPYTDANEGLDGCGLSLDEIFIDNVHLKHEGNRCVGRIIANFILTHRALPERLP